MNPITHYPFNVAITAAATCFARSHDPCPFRPPCSLARNVNVSEIPTAMSQDPCARPSSRPANTPGYPSTDASSKYSNRLRPLYMSDKPCLLPVMNPTPTVLFTSESAVHVQNGPAFSAVAPVVVGTPGLLMPNVFIWAWVR